MKVVYVAHPIKGDVDLNIDLINAIIAKINKTTHDVVPLAPYLGNGLNDRIPDERQRGIKNNIELLMRGFIDEMWLYGNKLSEGMQEEVKLAMDQGIRVVVKDELILHSVKLFIGQFAPLYPKAIFEGRLLPQQLKNEPFTFTIIFTKQDNTTVEEDIEAFDDLAASRLASARLSECNYKDWQFADGQWSMIQ